MSQKYKVFLNDRHVLLTTKWPKKLVLNNSYLAINAENKTEVKEVFELFYQTENIKTLVIINENIEKLWKSFKAMFKSVEAAGGLVKNKNGEFLMIFRRGHWDLPKGKLDKGESLKECSVREVEEECGISDIKLKDKLVITYHIYGKKEPLCLKPSHWYSMKIKNNQELIPQTEEDIEKAEWVSEDKVKDLLDNAYPSIKEVFKAAGVI